MTENGTRPTGIARIDGKYITAKPRLLEFQLAVSVLANSLKGVSSQMIRKKNYPCIRKKMWGAWWSTSYFAASCGGATVAIIRQYIEQQQTPA